MPVEIRELVIKATLVQDDGQEKPVAPANASERARIVEECVREVIRIIENNKKR
jgi:hypothetical protein